MAVPPNTGDGPRVTVMRSQLGQVRGMGSAHAGAHHWSALRWTSFALLPLTLWFIVSILRLAHVGQPQALHWAHQPVNAVLLLALVLTTFHHLNLGLQAVIEDYVHVEATRLGSLLLVKGAVALLALASVVSILKLAL
jgi:succinate dehydrogenase / fumarate reductase membrane anchor subunit